MNCMVSSMLHELGLRSTIVLNLEFIQSETDHGMFIHTSARDRTIILLNIDDIVIIGKDTVFLQFVKTYLNQQFKIKDLGSLRYFLGLEIAYGPQVYLLSQQKYTIDLLICATLTDDTIIDTPFQLNQKLSHNIVEPLANPTQQCELIGALIYLTISQPNNAYAVHVVSQFVQAPTSIYYAALFLIL